MTRNPRRIAAALLLLASVPAAILGNFSLAWGLTVAAIICAASALPRRPPS